MSTDLKLDDPGTLPRPGPIGRSVRLLLGILCLHYVVELLGAAGALTDAAGRLRPLLWNGLPVGLLLISYVVNIGWSRAWKKWPAAVSAAGLAAAAAWGYVMTGAPETPLLARVAWVWELYLFGHLGAAFVLAALLGTPGCELRAFHDLYSRVTGVATREHHCPLGPLASIDRWEAARRP